VLRGCKRAFHRAAAHGAALLPLLTEAAAPFLMQEHDGEIYEMEGAALEGAALPQVGALLRIELVLGRPEDNTSCFAPRPLAVTHRQTETA